jgi:hypothetical protein
MTVLPSESGTGKDGSSQKDGRSEFHLCLDNYIGLILAPLL